MEKKLVEHWLYDLTDGGWIRRKEFEHAVEDGVATLQSFKSE